MIENMLINSCETERGKWTKSRRMLERARQSLAGGVSSPFRAKFPVPLYFADACGSRMVDVDGNRYIDYTLAWGPLILGHKHPRIVEALRQAAERPHIYGAEHELEYQVAETIQEMVPCAERVAFTSSGSEAVQIALRLARAFTSRNLILKFEGHYHGWMDSILLSHHPAAGDLGPLERPNVVRESCGQLADAANSVVVAPFNRSDIVREIFEARGEEIAAVIVEPVMCNSGCILPAPGFLGTLRELTVRYGALLIFDEIITGFRIAPGGAQAFYGVTPDLATLGKALGGGVPLSAVAGRREILELMCGGGVSFGGTFNGNPVSLACARACLAELAREGGAALSQADTIGRMVMNGLCAAARRRGVPLVITGFGAAFAVHFTTRSELLDYRDTLEDDGNLLARFLLLALEQGVYILPDGRMYVSAVHSEADAEETVHALDLALAAL